MSTKELTIQLILKFLKENGYTETFLNLENEAKANLWEYPKQIQFFKKIMLKGDFNEAVQFMWTFEQKISNQILKKLTLQIYKQKLYELLQNPNQTQLRNLFQKEIINVCSQEEYQHLFTLLTCRSVKEIPGMDKWTAIIGRYSCFEQILPYLEAFFNLPQFKKSTNKTLTFKLQEVVESYVSAQKKAQQRLDKSENPIQQRHNISDKSSKQSIESKQPKYQNQINQCNSRGNRESEQKNAEIRSYEQLKGSHTSKQSYKNKDVREQSPSYILNMSNLTTKQNQNQKSEAKDFKMSQSKVQKSQYAQKSEKFHTQPEPQQNLNQESSIFHKKYNPYFADIGPFPIYNKSNSVYKNVSNYSAFPVKIQNIEQEQKISPYRNSQLYEKQKQRRIDRQKQQILTPSYLKQFEVSDSKVFEEQMKGNIAYLNQNNSIVEKDEENENFTFSNGAQQEGIDHKNRRILKLTSITDPKAIRTCQFSPSGTLFALGTNSSYLKIYDIEDLILSKQPKQINPLCQIPQLHTKSIFCLDWSANQNSIITCSNDLTIKITQFVQGFNFSNHKTSIIGKHESCVRMVKFNSQQNRVVSCGDDSMLKVWDFGKIKTCINLKGHTQSISAFRFADDNDDNIIYSVSKDCTIRKWDLRVGQSVTVSDLQDSELTFIANHIDRIVVSHKSGYVSFFNQQLQMQHAVQIHQQEIRSIDGTNYNNLLLTASFDGHVSIFTQKTSQQPNYHQHNENQQDKVVYATFLNHPNYHGFASTSTLGICNIYMYE